MTITRNVFRDHLRKKSVSQKRVGRAGTEQLARVQAEVATRTLSFLKTETKDRFALLRKKLPLEEQTLLILRVERKLPWDDVTQVMNDGEPLDGDTVKRRSAALRKRFERITIKLRELARQDGLLQ